MIGCSLLPVVRRRGDVWRWVGLEHATALSYRRYRRQPHVRRSDWMTVFQGLAPGSETIPRLGWTFALSLRIRYSATTLQYSSPKSIIYVTIRPEVHTATQEGVTSGTNSFMHYRRLKTQILPDFCHNSPSVYTRGEDHPYVSGRYYGIMDSPELAAHPRDGAYQRRSTSDLPFLLRR